MRRITLVRILLFVLFVALACGQTPGDAPVGLSVHEAALMAPPGSHAALYLRIENPGPLEDRLVGFETRSGAEGSLHLTVERDGRVSMLPAPEGFAVPARGTLRLAPGGAHGMVGGLAATLRDEETVSITLHFEKSASRTIDVPVVRRPSRSRAGK